MASQLRRVTGNRYGGNPAQAQLQAKIANLPATLANRQNKQILARDTKFQNQQISMMKKRRQMEQQAQERGMGLEAAKLGVTLGMSDFGSKSIGDAVKGVKGTWNGLVKGGTSNTGSNTQQGKSNMFSDFNLGGAISSGLTGYGVGKLVGGKNKTKKSLYGAGAGALMGLLSSKPGQGMYSGLSGLIPGGLGGLFS